MIGRKVLFVAPVEPWCRENGSSLITADLLEGLSTIREIDVLPVFVRKPPPGYDRIPPDGMDGVLLDIPGLPRWLSIARSVARRSSPLRHRFDNRRVANRIQEVVRHRDFEPDLVHVEHLPLVDAGLAVASTMDVPLSYRAHNVESRLWARRLGLPDPLKAPIVEHMERVEADAVRQASLTLMISRGDLEWARASAPDSRSVLLPCTLHLQRYDAVPRQAPLFEAQICFVGGLDWAPNEDGLHWFVREVLPAIVREMPYAGLAVLARGADSRLWLADNPSVRILAPEARAAELFASSHVSIAPLFQGGGVRIKIPESLALECPVVATTIGAEGHDLPGLTQVDEPRTFASACIQYLRTRARGDASLAYRHGVEESYGAESHARRLAELWEETIRARGGVKL